MSRNFLVSAVEGDLENLGDPYLYTMSCEVNLVGPGVSEESWWLRLQRLDLSERFQPSVRISRASLFGSRICQIFQGAIFSETTFQSADLSGCRFIDCHFVECALDVADCRHTVFSGCEILGVSFGEANLAGAQFDGSKIHGNFSGADLSGAKIRNCELGGVIHNTVLEGVALTASVAGVLHGDRALIRRLFELGLHVPVPDHIEYGWDPEDGEPEPSDETEAWFRRWLQSDCD